MNENIDLTKILKNCPKGWELYSSIHGKVKFVQLEPGLFSVKVELCDGRICYYTKCGKLLNTVKECHLFPSQDQLDWSKFDAPWYKKVKFDPKTLKPFDKVLVRDIESETWKCSFFSSIIKRPTYPYMCTDDCWSCCIPYNEDTKHLIGTKEEAPDNYRYWDNSN